VQFSHDPAALEQWWRQQTPDTAATQWLHDHGLDSHGAA
jgi:hypothetical protein